MTKLSTFEQEHEIKLVLRDGGWKPVADIVDALSDRMSRRTVYRRLEDMKDFWLDCDSYAYPTRWRLRGGCPLKATFEHTCTLPEINDDALAEADACIDLLGRAKAGLLYYLRAREYPVKWETINEDLHPFTNDELIPAANDLTEVGLIEELDEDGMVYRATTWVNAMDDDVAQYVEEGVIA